jgi:hypothetical protein
MSEPTHAVFLSYASPAFAKATRRRGGWFVNGGID